MLHHPLVIDRHQIGQQLEPITVGEQQQQLPDEARRLQPIQQLGNDRALVSCRNCRTGERLAQIGMAVHKVGKGGQFLLRLRGRGFG